MNKSNLIRELRLLLGNSMLGGLMVGASIWGFSDQRWLMGGSALLFAVLFTAAAMKLVDRLAGNQDSTWNVINRVSGCGKHEDWERGCDWCWDAMTENSEQLIELAADELIAKPDIS